MVVGQRVADRPAERLALTSLACFKSRSWWEMADWVMFELAAMSHAQGLSSSAYGMRTRVESPNRRNRSARS